MKTQLTAYSLQLIGGCKSYVAGFLLKAISYKLRRFSRSPVPQASELKASPGFTLIETLVAVSFLTVAIVAPMTLTTRSLSTAYYARDQITAFHLAQEAIETVRHVRDGNILRNALGQQTDLLEGIPQGTPFIVDTRDDSLTACFLEECPALKTDGLLYGHVDSPQWTTTRFTRTVEAQFVDGNTDEISVVVTVSWSSGSFQRRSFTISENLFRWIEDGSASEQIE